jgi:hypothetical protein
MARYHSVGPFSGIAACFIVSAMHVLFKICEYMWPKKDIEICPDFHWEPQHQRLSQLSGD